MKKNGNTSFMYALTAMALPIFLLIRGVLLVKDKLEQRIEKSRREAAVALGPEVLLDR